MTQKLLTQEYPLIVLPSLAKKLGATSATLLQQIHYWTQKKCGTIIDGVRWIYNTFQQWQEQLPYLSVSTIKRAIAQLRERDLIKVERHDKSQWNHKNYYTINYESLKALQLSIGSICTNGSGQFEPMDRVNLNQSSINPENTTRTTTETQLPVAVLKSEVQEIGITDEQINSCCTQISAVSREVQINLQVKSAIASYLANFPAALERLKKAVKEGWRCNLTGLLVKALKEGVAKEDAEISDFVAWRNSSPNHRYINSCTDTNLTGLENGQIGVLIDGKWLNWRSVEVQA